jgi:hypothetical protein
VKSGEEINVGVPVPFVPVGVLFPGPGPPSPTLKVYEPPLFIVMVPYFTSPAPPPPPSAPLAIPPPAPPPPTINIVAENGWSAPGKISISDFLPFNISKSSSR